MIDASNENDQRHQASTLQIATRERSYVIDIKFLIPRLNSAVQHSPTPAENKPLEIFLKGKYSSNIPSENFLKVRYRFNMPFEIFL